MVRMLVAALVGAVVLFAWGAVYWMFIAEKSGVMRPLPNEPAMLETLKTNLGSSGVYCFPFKPPEMTDPAAKKAADEQWTRRHEAGPIGMIIYRADGTAPMAPGVFIRGFVINFASALLVTLILHGFATGGMGFARRWAIAIMMGLFAALSTDALRGNWMFFPEPWTRLLMFDTVVGWVLAGGAIAALCKTPAGK